MFGFSRWYVQQKFVDDDDGNDDFAALYLYPEFAGINNNNNFK